MSESESSSSQPRYRSVPFRSGFYVATLWTILHLFCVFSTIIAIVMFFLYHQSANFGTFKRIIIVGAGSSVLTLIISYSKRRAARCPLCIGTPLLNSGALSHKRSVSLGPFNEGFTSVLSIACTQKFRCMYCGTRYDLLKPSRSKLRRGEE
jgi:hypothetical protein